MIIQRLVMHLVIAPVHHDTHKVRECVAHDLPEPDVRKARHDVAPGGQQRRQLPQHGPWIDEVLEHIAAGDAIVRRLERRQGMVQIGLEDAIEARDLFMTDYLRVYTNTDLAGVELGGSLKNVIAIAAGICDGLGYGDNTKGALLTRGLAEITRLGVVMGGRPETFAGLSGMGDLITTCISRHSRNRHVGEEIAAGKSLDDVLGAMVMVAEGVRTTRSAHELALKYLSSTGQTLNVQEARRGRGAAPGRDHYAATNLRQKAPRKPVFRAHSNLYAGLQVTGLTAGLTRLKQNEAYTDIYFWGKCLQTSR